MRPRLVALVTGLMVLAVCLCALPGAAWASWELEPGAFKVQPGSDQAGAHPDLTTRFAFRGNEEGAVEGDLRDVEVELPLGFAGYPTAVATCTPYELEEGKCPADSQVGTIAVGLRITGSFDDDILTPVYNLVPSPGETAVFGFVSGKVIEANIVVSVQPNHRVLAKVTNVISPAEIVEQTLTLWGEPALASHDPERGEECAAFVERGSHELGSCEHGGETVSSNPAAFLVNPSQCTSEPQVATLRVDSWEDRSLVREATTQVGPMTGCERLDFYPELEVAPESSQVLSPAGYTIRLRVPQNEAPEGVATADLRDAVVKLPRGVLLSPSAANGLVSCTAAQVGLGNEEPVGCPNASKLGEVSLTTPALSGELTGGLYLAGPPSGEIEGPPFKVFLTLAGHGVSIKVEGQVEADPVTGQLTTTFDESPELPFSELQVRLNGGSRSTVANPRSCGSFAAEGSFLPWTSPFEGAAPAVSQPFEITGCEASRFAPSFTAGTTSNQAGGYSPLSVTFSREDQDQELAGLTVKTPPGLSGALSHVPLCGEPQAAQGTCGTESQIGELTVGVGPGPEPLFIKGGKVFLTGPYGGAPFGLSIAVSEKAGPIDLGSGSCDCEVVRAAVYVDPHTAALTVVSQPLPTKKDGIFFQVKTVNVNIDRPEFTFNPTSCEPMGVTGTLSSTEGASSTIADHFQVTNCAALAFKPGFTVSTSSKTSRADGASLAVKLTFPQAPQGTQANIKQVKVELPKALPSRLTTLQKACTAAQFESNPSGCPQASIVGHAKAITPILPVPLEGPAYFVSHGGEAFPSLIVVLQGYGVTVDLVGTTFISKSGITSSTFKSVPDVPVGSFELTLPEGPYSALTASGDLCALAKTVTVKRKVAVEVHGHKQTETREVKQTQAATLQMPTEFVAQNGAEIHEATPIAVTGCPKAQAAPKKTSHKAKRKGQRKK
jgi:hypothetical protein